MAISASTVLQSCINVITHRVKTTCWGTQSNNLLFIILMTLKLKHRTSNLPDMRHWGRSDSSIGSRVSPVLHPNCTSPTGCLGRFISAKHPGYVTISHVPSKYATVEKRQRAENSWSQHPHLSHTTMFLHVSRQACLKELNK